MQIVIWAKPAGKRSGLDEMPISTQCRNQADIDKVTAAASKDGWHSFRIQTIDGALPNFAGCIAKQEL